MGNNTLLLTTTSMFYAMPGVNNAHLFVTASMNTFAEKKNCYKAVTSCFNLFQWAVSGCFNFVPTFSKSIWSESCQKVELNLCKLVIAVESMQEDLQITHLVFKFPVSFTVFNGLTHFLSLISFYASWKNQKTRGFLMFQREHIKRLVAWNMPIFDFQTVDPYKPY